MDDVTKVMVEMKREEQKETLTVLEALRKSRKARGGVGAPLAVPGHLRDAAKGMGIIITDADLSPVTKAPSREELQDAKADFERVLLTPDEE